MDTDWNTLCGIILAKKLELYKKYMFIPTCLFLGKREIKALKQHIFYLKKHRYINIISLKDKLLGLQIVEVKLDSFIEVGGIDDNT
jgi:hypothetical protein